MTQGGAHAKAQDWICIAGEVGEISERLTIYGSTIYECDFKLIKQVLPDMSSLHLDSSAQIG